MQLIYRKRFEQISLVIVLLTFYSMLTAQVTFGIRSGGVLSTYIYKYELNIHNTKSNPGYDLAMSDVIDYHTDQEMHNSGFGAGVGYQF